MLSMIRSTVSLLGNLMLRTSVSESRRAGEVLQQDFSSGLVFRTDEAEPQEKAAECVLLIFNRFFGRIDTALISCHFAQLADKGVIAYQKCASAPLLAVTESVGRPNYPS